MLSVTGRKWRWGSMVVAAVGLEAALVVKMVGMERRQLPKKHKRGQGIWRAQLVATSW
jgi:hypothetical protein